MTTFETDVNSKSKLGRIAYFIGIRSTHGGTCLSLTLVINPHLQGTVTFLYCTLVVIERRYVTLNDST